MQNNQLSIAFAGWVYRHFAPDIEGYCNILLNRLVPIFDDVEGEQSRAGNEFLEAAASRFGDDYGAAMGAAYEHAQERAIQFMEMRAVFLATGVSGLFHLFEKQLYKHINKELKDWLNAPVTDWRDLETLIPKFDRKWKQNAPCPDFIDAFRDHDLQELRVVANAVKHGDEGPSYRQLVRDKARVVDSQRLGNDWTAGPYSVLGVNISVQVDDVERYRDAILRFWRLDGTFWALREAFK